MRKVVAIIGAVVAAGCVVAALFAWLPAQSAVDPNRVYDYVSNNTKTESVAFTEASADASTYYVFGSSELDTMPPLVSSVPDVVFRESNCGMQFTYVGTAYDQSLFHTVSVGAYAPGMQNKKVVIIVSPQWFTDGGQEPGIAKMRFSYSLYREFCDNDAVSESTKSYVRQRLLEEGIDSSQVDAAYRSNPVAAVDDAVYAGMADLKLRKQLIDMRDIYDPAIDISKLPAPDFVAIRARALAQAQSACTNNDYGVYDSYWTANIAPRYDALANTMANETLTDTPEYDDFSCLLDICSECGLDPYIVIAPVNGKWYDYTGLSKNVRDAYYERVTDICDAHGVAYLDMSSNEYTTYYLRDIMHLGWLGWIDVEQGFMQFVEEG